MCVRKDDDEELTYEEARKPIHGVSAEYKSLFKVDDEVYWGSLRGKILKISTVAETHSTYLVSFERHRDMYLGDGVLAFVEQISEDLIDYDKAQKDIDEYDYAPFIEKLTEGMAKDPVIVFATKVHEITNGLAEMLISKNIKYGNSALEPKRIFSKANAVEQILVRIDDKISRMSNQDDLEDEDVVEDLLGYLVLLKIAKGN